MTTALALPSRLPALTDATVLCLAMRLDANWDAWLAAVYAQVSREERERARRFRFVEDAVRHLLGRALIRRLLAQATGEEAAQVEIECNAYGKPFCSDAGVEFNVSHAGCWVVLAATRGHAVGVDVEAIKQHTDWVNLAEMLHPDESHDIAALAASQQQAAFFRCWSRKEAVIKAIGTGLSTPLTAFRVSVVGEEQDWLLTPPKSLTGDFTSCDMSLAPDYMASVVAMQAGLALDIWKFGDGVWYR